MDAHHGAAQRRIHGGLGAGRKGDAAWQLLLGAAAALYGDDRHPGLRGILRRQGDEGRFAGFVVGAARLGVFGLGRRSVQNARGAEARA